MVVKTYESLEFVTEEIADQMTRGKCSENARWIAASNLVNGLLVSGLLAPIYNEATQEVQWELSTVASLVNPKFVKNVNVNYAG